MKNKLRFVIAGGGTGGHVFPMLSVANALKRIRPDSEILFVGTKDRIESILVPEAGYQLQTIPAGGLKGKAIFSKLAALAKLPLAMIKSAFILSKFGPHVVLGGGGYASWPLCRIAKFQGIPLALLEVNSLPGMANRKLAKHAVEGYVAFKATQERMSCKTVVTGNPIRQELRGTAPQPGKEILEILIIGGSQGAVGLNSLVLESLPYLARSGARLSITHQTGQYDNDRVRNAYLLNKVEANVTPFIKAMGTAYKAADLVIARAGATTVAELIAARRPAFLVPLPTAADNHQEINASEIVAVGGGKLFKQGETSGDKLAEAILDCYHRPELLHDMGQALAELDHPQAAESIAGRLIEIAETARKV